ncbi:MAG: hypothetical protein DMG83_03450 [Acidobacteria bacterium]|nr:MAG: hypothetical protein DMG83_03450 [Acidobacteriota bacterium]
MRRGRRPVCPAEQSSALGILARQQRLRIVLADCLTRQEMYDSFVDLLVRMRCTQEPAGLTPGRPDEGVWAYASNARPPRRGHLHAIKPKPALMGTPASGCTHRNAHRSQILEEGMGSTYS